MSDQKNIVAGNQKSPNNTDCEKSNKTADQIFKQLISDLAFLDEKVIKPILKNRGVLDQSVLNEVSLRFEGRVRE
jgi:hypothetical protein